MSSSSNGFKRDAEILDHLSKIFATLRQNIVGHKISDITEKVYTQREFDWLKTEIEK